MAAWVAGALYAHLAQAVNYESFLVLISITLLLQVVIGGLLGTLQDYEPLLRALARGFEMGLAARCLISAKLE